jgi:hypothetical protein
LSDNIWEEKKSNLKTVLVIQNWGWGLYYSVEVRIYVINCFKKSEVFDFFNRISIITIID